MPDRSSLRISLIGVASFLGSLAESAVLVIVTLTADSLIRGRDEVDLLGQAFSRFDAVMVALGCVLARICMTYLSARLMSRFSAGVLDNAQRAVLTAFVRSSHRARASRPPGDLSALVLNHARFTGDMANAFTIVAASICGLIAFGGMSLVVNPLATVGIALIGAALLGAMRPLRFRSVAAADEYSSEARTVGHEVTEVESLHREIEVFDVGDEVLDRLGSEIRVSANSFQRLRFLQTAIPQFFQASMLGAAVLSLLLIINSSAEADLAAIGAIVLLLIRSMSSAQQLVTAHQRVVEYRAYAISLNLVIGSLDEERRISGEQRPIALTPLRLKDVRFSYDDDTDVLKGLDLELRAGEIVGVVGPSGAGKSTLVELLLRLRLPTSGEITCGGVPIADLDTAEFARRVAFVPQQPELIAGTVAENVALFRDLPEARLRRAIEQAHLDEEVDALPDGIETRLSPDDRALSGGQRQRLTIARALAGDPEIIVLDEPTSALDAMSEHAIRQTLSELADDRLVIMVAHRYSTLRECTRILVLRDGRVEIDATPDEVAERSDFFRAMVSESS
jgi:ABC-type multidrug transport system fused ATPase/permease subunit